MPSRGLDPAVAMRVRTTLGFIGVVAYVLVVWQQSLALGQYKDNRDGARETALASHWKPAPDLSGDCKRLFDLVRFSHCILGAFGFLTVVVLFLAMLSSCAFVLSDHAKALADARACARSGLAALHLAFGLAVILVSSFGLFRMRRVLGGTAWHCAYLHRTAVWTMIVGCFYGLGALAVGAKMLYRHRVGSLEKKHLMTP
eukprot:CAMPEP_0117550724 /NCGR_PEP_ID=MMETSP0784-20121206/48826_1 /TAXON_ID=39447 /ORGANISM="" /LENGTH=199 /DNA_ID=CAMNT_0005347747 /DNA_START=46 /DNA_END=645 /DNA_ORIENTATION=-